MNQNTLKQQWQKSSKNVYIYMQLFGGPCADLEIGPGTRFKLFWDLLWRDRKKEQKDKPGWRSLELVNVPVAWGWAGASVSDSLVPDPTETEAACKEVSGPAGTKKCWRVMGLFSIYNTTNPRDIPAALQVWLSSASSPRSLDTLARKRVLKYTSVLVSAHSHSPPSACCCLLIQYLNHQSPVFDVSP